MTTHVVYSICKKLNISDRTLSHDDQDFIMSDLEWVGVNTVLHYFAKLHVCEIHIRSVFVDIYTRKRDIISLSLSLSLSLCIWYMNLAIVRTIYQYVRTNLLFVRTIYLFVRTNLLFVRTNLLFARTNLLFVRTILLFVRTIY